MQLHGLSLLPCSVIWSWDLERSCAGCVSEGQLFGQVENGIKDKASSKAPMQVSVGAHVCSCVHCSTCVPCRCTVTPLIGEVRVAC